MPGAVVLPSASVGLARSRRAATAGVGVYPRLGFTAFGEISDYKPKGGSPMIRKLADGRYRLYSRKKDPKTGKRRNLGTFKTRAAAEKHEREVQYFKRH